MQKTDLLGHTYDSSEPAFTAVGPHFYHLKTKHFYERSSFTANYGVFPEGELGTPSDAYIAAHEDVLKALLTAVVPTAPNTFAAAADGANAMDLSWVDASSGEAGFRVEVSDAVDGTFVTIADLAPGVTTYSHTGLTAFTAYFYELFAFNMAGDSTPAATATDTTDA